MTRISFIFILCLFGSLLHAQVYETTEEPSDFKIVKPSPTQVVNQHKANLELILIIDSIQFQNKTIQPKFRRTINIEFESDYIQVKDSFYIKIFISRNQEYGRKFYSWKWDYLIRRNGTYNSLGTSFYETMEYYGRLDGNGGMGHGVGIEGTKGYIMYYYRYSLK